MGMKKMLLTALVLSTVTSASAFAQAAPSISTDAAYQNSVKNNVESFVKKAYNQFYTINSAKLIVDNYSVKNNLLTAQVEIALTKTLNVKSVDDLPYVKGLKNELEILKSSNNPNAAAAEKFVNTKTNDLSDYIGVPQEQNESFRLTANLVNGAIDFNNAKLEILGPTDWVPASAFKPDSETDMIENGKQDVINATAVQPAKTSAEMSATFTYDRLAARDYANRWTSELVSGQDATQYNLSQYPTYYSDDCANYVSQSMAAGGIPQDSTWKPYTIPWINTGRSQSGLKQYMVDNKGYFVKTTKTGTSAGGFLYDIKQGESHVEFIVANDGVTMLYSAHTNDRKQHTFANYTSTDWEFYYISSAYQ
jgi:hypothetical protein